LSHPQSIILSNKLAYQHNENTTIIKNSSTQYSFKYVSNLMNSFYQPSKSQKTTGQQFFSVLTFTAKLTCFW